MVEFLGFIVLYLLPIYSYCPQTLLYSDYESTLLIEHELLVRLEGTTNC